jgi:Kef-type K+ transport system membrane component KefB
MDGILIDLGYVIIIATLLGYLAHLFKQPLIPMYILAGFLMGPVFGLITSPEDIMILAEIGIAFLLFIVGLEINFEKLKHVAFVSTIGGFIQISLLFSIGYFVAIFLGYLPLQAAYFGLILAFSSTMVVVKLLSDRREIDTLHGRIVIGILLIQDIFAIIALAILASINEFSINLLLLSLLKGFLLIIAFAFLGKYVFPKLFSLAARGQEMLFLLSITICFSGAIAFHFIGFSIAIGAFISGVAIANLPYNIEIIGKVKSLRDFFAVLFFVSLGLGLLKDSINGTLIPFVFILGGVLVLKPLVIMTICSIFGYKKKPSFLTSITLAQISEFSLIILSQGLNLGHISREFFSITIIATVITLVMTAYSIKYEKWIYNFLEKPLKIFEHLVLNNNHLEYMPKKKTDYKIIVCGADRMGYSIIKALDKLSSKVIVIDFNPEVVNWMIEHKMPTIYGDISDPEVLDRLNLKKVRLCISTIPELNYNLLILRKMRKARKSSTIFVTANNVEDALVLYNNGADYVILPHLLSGEHASILVKDFQKTVDFKKLLRKKTKHLKELKLRLSSGHR